MIRIDNQIVQRMPNGGISIYSIHYAIRTKRLTQSQIDSLPYIAMGTRLEDNQLITRILSGKHYNFNQLLELVVDDTATTYVFK